ncbi:hypothetical protein Ahy_B02g060670 [Arachis hypogaea]|uniref:Helicase ATP-binding domain-containing protein n=1 Tax=Arachis hypogaea TaxID=3818 RepID=A0A445AJ00_ARAHY|nr:hypothetical protein Ahy_B02g060670 [Arachis hypogaea]
MSGVSVYYTIDSKWRQPLAAVSKSIAKWLGCQFWVVRADVTSSTVAATVAAAHVARAPSTAALNVFAPFVVTRALSAMLLSYELPPPPLSGCFFSPRWRSAEGYTIYGRVKIPSRPGDKAVCGNKTRTNLSFQVAAKQAILEVVQAAPNSIGCYARGKVDVSGRPHTVNDYLQGPPLAGRYDMGALCMHEHSEKLEGLINDAIDKGSEIVARGSFGPIGGDAVNQYYPSTVIVNNTEVLRKMGKHTGISSECAVPTDSRDLIPIQKWKSINAQVVIGTPGTIKKWISFKNLNLTRLMILVFDEADQMLAEDGFKDDSLRIMKEIEKFNSSCQVLLFSATFNDIVKNFVERTVKKDHNKLFVKKEELSLDAVKQYKVHCPDKLSKIEERAKALEVIQYLKEKYHEGKCNVAIVDDGKLDTESDSGEFWVLFGGFAPIGKKVVSDDDIIPETTPGQLFSSPDPGGLSSGYKKLVADKGLQDETYTAESVALIQISRTAIHNNNAVQVDAVAASLNSAECFVLQSGSTMFTWHGNQSSFEQQQQLTAKVAEFLKPGVALKHAKEGTESSAFWFALGGKQSYTSFLVLLTRGCRIMMEHLSILYMVQSQDRLNGLNQGGPRQRAEALADLNYAFKSSSGTKSSSPKTTGRSQGSSPPPPPSMSSDEDYDDDEDEDDTEDYS